MGLGKKVYSNGPGHLLFFIMSTSAGGGARRGGGGRGAGAAFSRDFTINLSPQCRAFGRVLRTEKLKAPLFPSPVGAGLQMTGA